MDAALANTNQQTSISDLAREVLASPELAPGQIDRGPNESAFQVLARRLDLPHNACEVLRMVEDSLSRVLECADEVLASTISSEDRSGSVLVRFDDHVAYVHYRGRRIHGQVIVAGATPEAAQQHLARIAGLVRRADTHGDRDIDVRFWHGASNGTAFQHTRTLEAPLVDEIIPTLAADSATALEAVALDGWQRGGMHIWHGPPGCGKTTAIRALALAWRAHVSLDIVLDPEVMLGSTEYLMGVLHATSRPVGTRPSRPARRVLVLEDAGELVAPDARAHAGAGISRLLNLTDGMFGHDEAPIVIITTNEPVTRVHPAMLRPGRCRSVVEFGPLPADRARTWLATNGLPDHDVDRAMTIAELAAIADDQQPVLTAERQRLGFAV